MEKEMTRTELVEAERAYCGRTKYGKGCYGQKLTKKLLDSKMRQQSVAKWYNSKSREDKTKTNYEYLLQFCDGNWFIADCCGLIKGIRAGYRADGTVGKMTSAIDQTIEEMVDSLEDVKDDPKEAGVGEMMFFSDYSHVMTVSEKGKKDIESAPSLDGVAEVEIGYQPLKRIGGAGKLPWVDYVEHEMLECDGLWGEKTTRRAQEYFGTTIDGEIWRQLPEYKDRNKGLRSGWKWNGKSSDIGSQLIRVMQGWLGIKVTGHLDTEFVNALERKMGLLPDGFLGNPSITIKRFQKFLNESERVRK